MRNAGLEEAQAGIKIAGRNINHLRYTDDTTLIAESEEDKKPLDESERGERKCWVKAQHSENEDHGIWSHQFSSVQFIRSVMSDSLQPLLISWLQSPSAVILEPPKIKSDTVSTVSPSISHEVMGPDAMIFVL